MSGEGVRREGERRRQCVGCFTCVISCNPHNHFGVGTVGGGEEATCPKLSGKSGMLMS